MDKFRTLFFVRARKIVMVALALGIIYTMLRGLVPPQDRLPEGMALPKGTLAWVQGGEGQIQLGELKGKGLLLNFWATWCGPCQKEIPALQRLHERYGGEHFTLIGITNQSPHVVGPFLQKVGVTYPIMRDPGGRFGDKFKVKTIPFTIFVSPDGKVVGDITGELDYEDGAERIEQLIELAKNPVE